MSSGEIGSTIDHSLELSRVGVECAVSCVGNGYSSFGVSKASLENLDDVMEEAIWACKLASHRMQELSPEKTTSSVK